MSKKKLLKLLIIFIPCLLLDQITKFWSRKYLKIKSISIVKGVLELEYLENRGAVWGSFQNKTTIFIIMTIIMVILLLYAFFKVPDDKRFKPISYILIFLITGAIGNFIDRAVYGYVTDFIYFKIIDFPVFNVADIYVTCSVFILAALVLFYYKDEDFEWIGFSNKERSGDNDE